MKNKTTKKYHISLILILIIFHYLNRFFYTGLILSYDNFYKILLDISFFTTFFSIYFINYYWVCPNTLPKKKIIIYLFAVFGLIVLFSTIRFILQEVLGFYVTGNHNYHESKLKPVYYIFDNSYYAIKAILFSTLLFLYLKNKDDKEKMYLLQLENKKMQIDMLLAQISPHFLFNTLNTIYVDVLDKAPNAANNIYSLSKMLHYLTHQMRKKSVPLKEEISFIEAYIRLNKERFENQLNFNYNIEGDVGEKKIVPLVLVHFLENIFKHGVLDNKNCPASFNIKVKQNYLLLKTKNKVMKPANLRKSGIGKMNIRNRLDLIFPNLYELSYVNYDYYEVKLKLPLMQN